MSVPELKDLTDRAGVFESISGTLSASTALAGGDHVERLELLGTTPNYFEVLGAKAAIGRTYSQAEWAPGFLEGIVISDALWRRQFGADPHVIGKRVTVDEDPYTIIGVMPPGFRHPGRTVTGEVDMWAASGFSADPFPAPPVRSARFLDGSLGRLKAGVSLEQAQRRLADLAIQLTHENPTDYPDNLRWTLRLESAQASLTGGVRSTLTLLVVAAGVVLLIVCVNIAGLLLARSAARSREFAIRQAVGASSARLAQQVLTESLILSFAGGIAAVIVLSLLERRLIALLPADIPRLSEIHIDWRFALAAVGLSIATGILFGLTPALRAAASVQLDGLREGGRTGSAQTSSQRKSRGTLVAVEIALSVVLLVGGGLLVRSFVAVLGADSGITTRGLIAAQVWVPVPNHPELNPYRTVPQQGELARRLLDALNTLPGNRGVAIASATDIPFVGSGVAFTAPFSMADEAITSQSDHSAVLGSVSPAYFSVIGAPIKRGRAFTEHDDDKSPSVVIVNEAFVRRFSPTRDVVGRSIRGIRGFESLIVGVVGDIRHDGLDAPVEPRVYLPILQRPTVALGVLVRTQSDVRAARDAIVHAVAGVDPQLPVFGVRTMDDMIAASMARRRFVLVMTSAFAISALLLAAIGIYGVMSFLIAQRTQEFGIRLALGASPRSIFATAVRPGFALAAIGGACGLALAIVASRFMAAVLFGVSAGDPVTFVSVIVLLCVVAFAACVVPARRAMRTSPAEALRA